MSQPDQPRTPDPLELLARPDKWYVSGAKALVFAPPFPLHVERPGFWDPAHYLHFPLDPLFTYALVGDDLREVELRHEGRRWRPDRTEVRFSAPGLEVTERRVMLENDSLVARVTVTNSGQAERSLQVVAWTAQAVSDNAATANGEAGTATAAIKTGGIEDYRREGNALALTRTVVGARKLTIPLSIALALEGAESFSVNISEPTANHPRFRLTPFYEKLTRDGLPGEERLAGLNPGGLLYMGAAGKLVIPAGGSVEFTVAASLATDIARALSQAVAAAGNPDPVGEAERAWRDYYSLIPTFTCEDKHLEHYWYYRWYGIRLNTIDPREGNYQHKSICEGIGYFRLPISYSQQVHLKETRWMRDPTLARDILETALTQQTERGTFPAHLYLDWKSDSEIYHADWGGAFDALDAVHPQDERLERAYEGLARYARYFQRERDAEGSGLYDIINQWETGQEYMSRYFAADDLADLWQNMRARLKGVDATVYIYRLYGTLAGLAERLGRAADAEGWRAAAASTARAIRERCWDPASEAYYDIGPDGQRTSTLSATSFYPYLTDLGGKEELNGLKRHLLNEEEFWTDFPVPTSSLQDPYFSATPEWKGKRHNCPWNGRTWPMTNSHIVDVLATASRHDPSLRATAADLMKRFVHMMFEDGLLERPNCFEHYHPFTGRASTYRGVDDYMHSYVADLLVRFVAGVNPEGERVRIDPYPFSLGFSLDHVLVRGHELSVSYDHELGFQVVVDGQEYARHPEPTALELPF
jgi:hypothetical protein